jgi:ABC-2 type transport system permease protein
MTRYLKLYLSFLRTNILKTVEYRANFLFGLLMVMFESATVYIGLVVLFDHIGEIAGWTYHDMLVLVGIFMITHALAWLFYKASINHLDRFITNGDLDWLLIKPVDTQFLVSVHRIDLEDAGRSLVGIAVIIAGLQGTSFSQLAIGIPLCIILLLAGQVILYSITLAIKTISFKSIQGWGVNSIYWRFHDLARYPTDIYRGIIRVVYTFVFPLIFIATVPAKALTGRLTLTLFVGALVAAALSFFLARRIWLFALSHYSSASS